MVKFIDARLDLIESDDSDDSNFELIDIFYLPNFFLLKKFFYSVVYILREQGQNSLIFLCVMKIK